MFNWKSLFFDEILELYGGNIFMAEMDYEAQGYSHLEWCLMLTTATLDNTIPKTVVALMIERAGVRK